MMAQSYPLRCFVEYPPAQQPPTQNNAPLACGIPPVVYPPPPMMQAYDVYHSPPPPPPPKKMAKEKKREKRAIMATAAVKRKQPSPSSSWSLADIQSRIYKNGKLDPDLLKGLCRRSTGKWQAQLYWGGKNQYIGTFDSQDDAALACAIVQEELGHNGSRIDPKTTVGQLMKAREKAFEAVKGVQQSPVAKKAKTVVESKKPIAKATRVSTRKKSPPSKPEPKRAPRATPRKADQDKKSRKARKSIKKKESDDEPRKSNRGVFKKKGTSSKDSAMDADVSRGVTIRPSNRWQAQIYFQGKSRYIGVFESKEAAAHAFVVTRGLLKSEPQVRMEAKEASDTFIEARDKAFLAVRAEKNAKNLNDYNW